MNKKTITVREGNTGILYLTDADGKIETYIPDYNLDKARELLLEFQELKNADGVYLKDNYWKDGYNWFPSMVSYLYWHVFFNYVKYKPLINKFVDKKVIFHCENPGNFANLISIMSGDVYKKNIKNHICYTLVSINNRFVMNRYSVPLLFFRFSLNDFRSAEIKKTIDELKVSYIQILPTGRIIETLKNLLYRKPYYFYGNIPSRNIFRNNYAINFKDNHKNILFRQSVEALELTVSGFIAEFKRHRGYLKNRGIQTLYGFDDANGYIFPMLYACRENGIKTIAHQHGTYSRRHAAYIMEGIGPAHYQWFDKLIVWGDYWKDHLLRISKVYAPDRIVIGGNKIPRDYKITAAKKSPPKNILIPYEFLTNTYRVGKYIMKFIDLGYDIYFKPRTDEKLTDQLESYNLTDEYVRKIIVVDQLDNKAMESIDIIAGTMTTLIYELLPYNKIVWVLDMEFRLIDDLVEWGYAHKVRYDDLDSLDETYFRRTVVDSDYFFSSVSLKNTLSKHVFGISNID